MENKVHKIFSNKSRKKLPATILAWRGAILVFVLTVFQTANFAQAVFDLPAPKLSVERSLKKDEKHVYQILLEQNQFAQVRVEQLGVGVYLSAYDPEGNLILTSESRNRVAGLEAVSVIAARAGIYRFEVGAALALDSGDGKYRIELAAKREAVSVDKDLLETEQIFMAAMRLANKENFTSRRESLDKYAQAAAGFQRHNDLARAAIAFNQLGHTQNQLGEKQAALENFQKALQIFRNLGDWHGETVALRFIGSWYTLAGEREKAIEVSSQALEIARKNRHAGSESIALQTLADVYSSIGETEKAISLFEQALRLRGSMQESGLFTNHILLNRIGDLYAQQKNWQKALDSYLQAVNPNRRSGGVNNFPPTSLWRLGRIYVRLGEAKKALEFLEEAKRREEKIRNPQRLGNILLGLGEAHFALGEKEKALEFFRESAASFQSVFNSFGESFAHFSAAQAQRDLGNFDAARTEIETTLQIAESLRSRLNNQDFRVSYFATTEDFYDFYLELLWQMRTKNPAGNYVEQSWVASERLRARTLAELLREARIEIRKGVALELLERERALQNALNDKAELHLRFLAAKNEIGQTKATEKEIEKLTDELSTIQTKIRQANPNYAALTQTATPDLNSIQNALGDDTILLEYKLGTARSFLWLMAKDTLEIYELPGREEIERTARQFYEKISVRNPQAQIEVAKLSENLSRILLAPVAGKLKNKRLVIVADGALQLVPFASLKVQNLHTNKEQRASTKDRFLIETNEIVSLPSATILPLLRTDKANRKQPRKTLAVFADPVFTSDDSRVSPSLQKTNAKTGLSPLQPKTRFQLSRLLFSRREALSILSIAPPAETFAALDFAANRNAVLKMELSNFRILHFATHGWLDATHPQLSGIVLSLVDDSGASQIGFLRLHEIYNLDLAADLVVLSACQTALGKEIRGEGIIGLTRGFMYAGANRVVASLWKVDDAATAELMRLFYQNLLQKKLAPSSALRQAQNEMKQAPRFRSPYFWAGFTLQGDWK